MKLIEIYTFNLLGILLLYYFFTFIFNNPYLLFQISRVHNSATVQNRTQVYIKSLISNTQDIISCSNVPKSWNTLYN